MQRQGLHRARILSWLMLSVLSVRSEARLAPRFRAQASGREVDESEGSNDPQAASGGVKLKDLAARFKVSEAAISMAVKGRTWGDLKTTYVLTSMASPGPQRSSLRRGLAGPGLGSRKLESAFPSAPALTRIDGRSDVGPGA